jgi:hypothetical protein
MARLSMGLSLTRYCATGPKTRWAFRIMNSLIAILGIASLLRTLILCWPSSQWIISATLSQCRSVNSAGPSIFPIICKCLFLRKLDYRLKSISSGHYMRVIPPHRTVIFIMERKAPKQTPPAYSLDFWCWRTQRLTTDSERRCHNDPRWTYYTALVMYYWARHSSQGLYTFLFPGVLLKFCQAIVTLMVCNLLVIVTFVYSMFWKDDGDNSIITEPTETRDQPSADGGRFTSLGPAPITTEKSGIILTEISETPVCSMSYTSSDPESRLGS